jgi:hypothetical protein
MIPPISVSVRYRKHNVIYYIRRQNRSSSFA